MKWVEFSEETLHEVFANDDEDEDDAVLPAATASR